MSTSVPTQQGMIEKEPKKEDKIPFLKWNYKLNESTEKYEFESINFQMAHVIKNLF